MALVAIAIGAGLGYTLKRQSQPDQRAAAAIEESAAETRAAADAEKKAILLEAKEEAIRTLAAAEDEAREMRVWRSRPRSGALRQKEENLDRKTDEIETPPAHACSSARRRAKRASARSSFCAWSRCWPSNASPRSPATKPAPWCCSASRKRCAPKPAAERASSRWRRRQNAETQARKILSVAIQRYSSDTVGEITTTVVPIPNEEMKGRIIGREGRNIRALEAATGVDLIIDDTPDAVTLSCFDPVRREIARLALTKLVQDGRIHPARIEEIVAKSKQEIEQEIREEGEAAAYEAGVPGLHPEIIKVVGRLKFRTSYGQNQLQHAVEAAHIGADARRQRWAPT